MGISSKVVANKLADIFTELNNSDYLANPFFRISKATPEQMRKYQYINSKSSRITVLIHLLIAIPINIGKIFIYLFFSFIFFNQYRVYNYATNKSEILFLSHAIGENITKTDGDQFFALMPENLQKKSKKVSILYTNHSLFGYYKNNNSLKTKGISIERHLIPKFLKPLENIDYLKLTIPASMKCLFYGLKKLLSNPIESTLLIKSSLFFYSRSTYSNYLVGQRVKEFCMKNNIEILVMTFEGHSYEQYIIEKIYKSNPKFSIVLYQHSPIVTDHFGVQNFLKVNTRDLRILTTGIAYERMFKSISNIPKYHILGSNKAISNFVEDHTISQKQILFAPEGTAFATIKFLKLMNYLCQMDHKLLFSIRLHPNLKRNFIVFLFIKRLNLKGNFLLSNNLLHEDLKKSKFVFYRSSAVGIEALMSNAVPVYYNSSTELGLNVLGKYSEFIPVVTNYTDTFNYIRTASTNISKEMRRSISNEIFTEIDYEKLSLILKN